MRILQFKSRCSEEYFQRIETLAGEIPLDEFLRYALDVGLGHIEEESILRRRERTYENLAIRTKRFHRSAEQAELKPLEQRPAANGDRFGQDITVPRALP